MVKRGQATAEDIIPIVKRLLPPIKKAIKRKFYIKICDGMLCELWRRGTTEKPNTMMISVGAINFFWMEYGKSLEKTIRNVLVHEAIHVLGLDHNKYGHKIGYYSNTWQDTLTPFVEKQIFG